MQYTEEDLKVGTKLRCTDAKGFSHWTTGKVYTVKYGTQNNYVECDNGAEIRVSGMLRRLNKKAINSAEFEIIKEEEQMQYTEKDLKEGTKLICTHATPTHWTVGKLYEVSLNEDDVLAIKDNNGYEVYRDYMVDCLNGNHRPVVFEIVNEEETMQEFKLGDLVEITSNTSNARNEKDELYNVGEKAIITDVFSTTVRIGNNKWANLITKDELKKVEPTATITVDVEQRLNDKIELLDKERMNIINKIERMKAQQLKLRDKVLKLNEAKKALEILKEFE